MSHRLTLQQLYGLYPSGLTIAAYQRHYVWGQKRASAPDAATYLTDCLLKAFKRGENYFLQGITICDSHLVDGQQRLTYLYLLLKDLGYDKVPRMLYENRPTAQQWLEQPSYHDIDEDDTEVCQDIYYFKHTLRVARQAIKQENIEPQSLLRYLLQKVEILYLNIENDSREIDIYQMMNGAKAPMEASDIIKADLIRMASDPLQPNAYDWEIDAMRQRYASEWGDWTRWWGTENVRRYYKSIEPKGIDLLLKLCLRTPEIDHKMPLTHAEYQAYVAKSGTAPYHAAKHLYTRLRQVQQRIEQAFDSSTAYNQIQAILLLQTAEEAYKFLHLYFVDCEIGSEALLRYYKLSFLGMSISEIRDGVPADKYFDDLLASLSMADVYHSDTKRDVFNLLLRLNIDEDTKLGRKFDFTIWGNRSLEHIYSKSKVWHTDERGRIYDGNDNLLNIRREEIERDPSYMPRTKIVNQDGTQLSEHCIGNLVLLYGTNNAAFGNTGFDKKKMMFLTPGDMTVFESRNLLHTVCVFAGRTWNHQSIVDNYNLTLKNLKIYYGFK